jgi:hypothetical protein
MMGARTGLSFDERCGCESVRGIRNSK